MANVTKSKVEKYITENNITGKLADVLTDYAKGYKELYEICGFYCFNVDTAVYHINNI